MCLYHMWAFIQKTIVLQLALEHGVDRRHGLRALERKWSKMLQLDLPVLFSFGVNLTPEAAANDFKRYRFISGSVSQSIASLLVVKNVRKWGKNVDQCFSKPKMQSSGDRSCPQPKHIQFTVIEEERNQNIYSFIKIVAD